MKPAIRVDNLSKKYYLGSRTSGSYRTLAETISESVAAACNCLRRRLFGTTSGMVNDSEKDNSFWALKDVSFEVQPGEVIGVIGRNGAGKSTLLKILSRVTEPSEGRVELRGRVGSLLEVGTGFHTELTGRENIYLNGSILGMKHREIARKFDEIVSFAEVEQFLDTPVKRYSSGMFVRLAFAVAAFLEPEILVVDEVLAVGDSAFQQRCQTRIREVARSGATVFFVSHNMGTVATLCTKALVLQQGNLLSQGPAHEQIGFYRRSVIEASAQAVHRRTDRTGNGSVRLSNIAFLDPHGAPLQSITAGSPLLMRFDYTAKSPISRLEVWAWINDEVGGRLTLLCNRLVGFTADSTYPTGSVYCSIPEIALVQGRYWLDVLLVNAGDYADSLTAAASFEVLAGAFYSTGRSLDPQYGRIQTRQGWSTTLSSLSRS